MSEIPEDIMRVARDIMDNACLGEPWVRNGTDAALRRDIARALLAERERLELVRAQAYQVIGSLLDQCGMFDSDEGIRALDYFSGDDVDDEFLPWRITRRSDEEQEPYGLMPVFRASDR